MSTYVDTPGGDHPLDAELVGYADDLLADPDRERVARHVVGCGRCQRVLDELGPGWSEGDVDAVVASVAVDIPGDKLATLPTLEVEGEPATGQLWLLEWAGSALLAAVLDAAGTRFLVAPATAEVPDSAEAGIPVAPAESPTGAALHLWGSLRRDVPLGVFLRPVGRLPATVVAQAASMSPVPPSSWTSALQSAELVAAIGVLANSTWVPEPELEATASPIAELVRAKGLRPQALAEQSGVPVAVITEIVRERRAATLDEASRLAAVLDVEPAQLRRPIHLPAALVHAVERPVHRLAIRARAAAASITEAAARLLVAQAVVATPARTTATERDVETWDQLVRHHLGG